MFVCCNKLPIRIKNPIEEGILSQCAFLFHSSGPLFFIPNFSLFSPTTLFFLLIAISFNTLSPFCVLFLTSFSCILRVFPPHLVSVHWRDIYSVRAHNECLGHSYTKAWMKSDICNAVANPLTLHPTTGTLKTAVAMWEDSKRNQAATGTENQSTGKNLHAHRKVLTHTCGHQHMLRHLQWLTNVTQFQRCLRKRNLLSAYESHKSACVCVMILYLQLKLLC